MEMDNLLSVAQWEQTFMKSDATKSREQNVPRQIDLTY